MKYGIFADVHSNLEALEAVIMALEKEGVEKYFCVGDIVGYAANPRECIQTIQALDCVTICGNHDWAAVGLYDYSNFNIFAKAAVEWTKNQLDATDKDYLSNLPLTYADGTITMVHGSLENPGQFEYIFDASCAFRTLQLCQTNVCFVGHTHLPAEHTRGTKRLINVGSVGQPRDGNPRAAYCVYDVDTGVVRIKRVEYNVQAAIRKILDAGLPHVLAFRLKEGR